MKKEIQIIEGLQKLPKDSRDFSLNKVFGTIDVKAIPDKDFMVCDRVNIKDQGTSDICVAAASCAVSEDQENVPLSMEWFFSQVKKAQGNWETWGANLRDACKVAIKVGFLEKADAPFDISDGRNFIADWENWPSKLDSNALIHRKKSYFKVDGPYDTFNCFRANLWQHRESKSSILTGVIWQTGWNNAKDGIIDFEGTSLFGHALKICGQKKIDGKWFLVGQLSNGKSMGKDGLFFFSQDIINKYFKYKEYGAYQFIDLSPEEAKVFAWSFWRRIWEYIKNIFLKKITIS